VCEASTISHPIRPPFRKAFHDPVSLSKLQNYFANRRRVEHLGKQGHDAGSPVVVERLTRLYAAVGVVARIWRNNYRFASDGVLIRDFLDRKIVRARDNKGAKAQVLRKQAHLLLLGARTIIKAGKEAWT